MTDAEFEALVASLVRAVVVYVPIEHRGDFLLRLAQCVYCILGPRRSVPRTARVLDLHVNTLRAWAGRDRWAETAVAYDDAETDDEQRMILYSLTAAASS